ncbi:MAG TPA: flippase activity-associated protein Agl23, partial [Chloroflexota bacterium]|nr:flippase activity-associated protein Agl23 [Chloroflexota bacterium]
MAATIDRPRQRVAAPEREAEHVEVPPSFHWDAPPQLPRFTVEQIAWFFLVAAAFVMRIWNVGARAMHHDESMHAFYSWQLMTGGGYKYDPMLHGPFIYHAHALMMFLFGASDTSARLTAVVCGTGVVLATWWLRPWLGKLGAFLAGIFFTISPSFLYYSRFTREDIYVTFFTFLMVVGMFGWIKWRKPACMVLLFCATALAFATKESTFITLFMFGTFLTIVLAWENAERIPIVKDYLTRWSGWNTDHQVTAALLAVSRRTWYTGIICFAAIIVALFTTFLTNRHGLQDAFTSSLTYWLSQQGVARGDQPGFYYALLLPAYEQVPVLFGLIGMVYLLFRRWAVGFAAFAIAMAFLLAKINGHSGEMEVLALTSLVLGLGAAIFGLSKGRLFAGFLAYWSILAFIIYSWAGEKMPWLTLQIALPLLLLAALFLGEFLSSVNWRAWDNWRWAAAAGAAFLCLFAIHADWPLNYIRGDIAQDPLIYTQTSPQVKEAVDQINQLSDQMTGGKDLKITYDTASTWPFAWYLRDYKNISIVQNVTTAPDTPIVITAVDNDATDKPNLSNYVGNRYHLRNWFDEVYRQLTFQKVVQSVTDPTMRKTLWNWLTLRQTPTPLGYYDFNLWIRKDLAPGVASNFGFVAPAAPAAAVAGPDPFAGKETKIASVRQIASIGTGDGQLNSARGVAVAPDGSMYVADQGNNRIEKFDATGKFVLKFGAKGTGDGQFDTPSGITVDKTGNVWVADLWNHRVEEFDPSGKFLLKFGSYAAASGQDQPGKFFGPRYIAAGPDGSIYVTDTGNKRVQQFKPDGTFVRAWGTGGNGPGQFQEPMGIAVDGQGN